MYSQTATKWCDAGPQKGMTRDHALFVYGPCTAVCDHITITREETTGRQNVVVLLGGAGPQSERCRDFSTASGSPPMRSNRTRSHRVGCTARHHTRSNREHHTRLHRAGCTRPPRTGRMGTHCAGRTRPHRAGRTKSHPGPCGPPLPPPPPRPHDGPGPH